jgi:hypothetical protein
MGIVSLGHWEVPLVCLGGPWRVVLFICVMTTIADRTAPESQLETKQSTDQTTGIESESPLKNKFCVTRRKE